MKARSRSTGSRSATATVVYGLECPSVDLDTEKSVHEGPISVGWLTADQQ